MTKINLSIPPQEATKIILKKLPTKRMRDVLEKRFGLKGSRRHTLESIGREYKITRERVRQIEADALKHLGREENLAEIKPVLTAIHDHIKNHGEVMAENHLFSTLTDKRYHSHLALLLGIGNGFRLAPETDYYHNRWAVNTTSVDKVETIMKNVVGDLSLKGKPVSKKELDAIVDRNAKSVSGSALESHVLESYLVSSKVIDKNPYGEYGLVTWPTINPRGIKDKAYVALSKEGKAMHFLEIAGAINSAGWSKRKAHPQTVHNELIKDHRFVLVGRGLYALKEWGYEPGVVRDVLVSVLKEAKKPLEKEEIIKGVLERRFVKAPTILLNLQNKNLFKRNEDGKYTLV